MKFLAKVGRMSSLGVLDSDEDEEREGTEGMTVPISTNSHQGSQPWRGSANLWFPHETPLWSYRTVQHDTRHFLLPPRANGCGILRSEQLQTHS